MRRNYFGWLVISLTVLIGGCSDPKTTTGVESSLVGTYAKSSNAEQAAASWTGRCRVEAVQNVASWVYLYFKSSDEDCYFSSIKAKGDTGRTWAVIGSQAMSNWSHGAAYKLFVQYRGSKVLRIRLCYGTSYGGICSGM